MQQKDRIIKKMTTLKAYGKPDIIDDSYAIIIEGKIVDENKKAFKLLLTKLPTPHKSILAYKPETKEIWISKETMEVIPMGGKLIIKKKQ